MLKSPYTDVLEARAQARANRKPVALKLRASVLDNGNPSPAAIQARNARLAADVAAAELRDARTIARGDYSTPTYRGRKHYA